MIETKIKLFIPKFDAWNHVENAVVLFKILSNSKRFSMEIVKWDKKNLKLEDDDVVIEKPLEIFRYLSQYCLVEKEYSLIDIPKGDKDMNIWIQWSLNMKSGKEVGKLNHHLSDKTYLLGTRLSIADVFTLAKLQEFKNQIHDYVPNMFHFARWYMNMMEIIRPHPNSPIPYFSFMAYLSSPPPFNFTANKNPVSQNQGESMKLPPQPNMDSKNQENQKKKQPKNKNQKKKNQPAQLSPNLIDHVVGKVLKITVHPDLSFTYVEEIDIGLENPITVCSGLGGKIEMNHLLNKLVIVMINLKPRVMKSVTSMGMLLCGTSKEKIVSLLNVPENSKPGERCVFQNSPSQGPLPQVPPKKLSKLLKQYHSDEQKQVCCGNFVMSTSKGIVSTTEPNSTVS